MTKEYIPIQVENDENKRNYKTLDEFYNYVDEMLVGINNYLNDGGIFKNISNMIFYIKENEPKYGFYYHIDKNIDKNTCEEVLKLLNVNDIESSVYKLLYAIVLNEIAYYDVTANKLHGNGCENGSKFNLWVDIHISSVHNIYNLRKTIVNMMPSDTMFNYPILDSTKVLAKNLIKTMNLDLDGEKFDVIELNVFKFLDHILSLYINKKSRFKEVGFLNINSLIPKDYIEDINLKMAKYDYDKIKNE